MPWGSGGNGADVMRRRWRARPWTARVVLVVATLMPLVASLVVARLLLAALPAASGGWEKATSLVAVIGAATLVFALVQRPARRLWPLCNLW